MNGTGDDACLGWVGRACATARQAGQDLTCYNLGIRGDTTTHVRGRWRQEAEARLLPEHDGRLLFSFGANDCCVGPRGQGIRVPAGDTLRNTEAILAEASAWRPTLMVGPPPVGDAETDQRIAALSWAFSELCARTGVPYLPLFDIVAASRAWAFEVAAGDGAHPNGGGYSEVANAFMEWAPWRRWVGLV